MTLVHRVLYPMPILSLDEYVTRGGGKGIEAVERLTGEEVIARVLESGLRGRGGAGFPTGLKWQTVAGNWRPDVPSTVVVNAAEGEPGTFKDRTILRRNPYLVIEGAIIAARAVSADLVIVATKQAFEGEVERLRTAMGEAVDAGWAEGLKMRVFEGPNEYLFGEESALLETIDGRWPFPRVVPTFRRGLEATTAEEVQPGPALVNNVETLSNVARIVARGPAWYRTVGTDDSPGTVVCTVTGATRTHGVGEVRLGTPLREVIDAIGGGPREGHSIKAVLSGVSSGVIMAHELDTPVTYEALGDIGAGVGSGGFMVFDDSTDMAAVAAGVSRFLAVESCGQCLPCKLDGLILSQRLEQLCTSDTGDHDAAEIDKRLTSVSARARCFLASQQEAVVGSIRERFPEDFDAHLRALAPPVEPALVAELVDIRGGRAYPDDRQLTKHPDWTYGARDSGSVPVEKYHALTPPWRASLV